MSGMHNYAKTLKPNYKSTPIIKNSLNLNEDNSLKITVYKETFHSNKVIDKNIIIDVGSNNFLNPTKRLTPKSNLAKNPPVNLWRKPVTGVGTQGKSSDSNTLKNSKTKAINLNLKTSNTLLNNNIAGNNTNILSTNYTDNKRDDFSSYIGLRSFVRIYTFIYFVSNLFKRRF